MSLVRPRSTLHAFMSFVFLSCLSACQRRASADQSSDAQSLPADWEPLQIGWPLGAPRSCEENTGSLLTALQKAAEVIQQNCNEHNKELRKAGYPSCGHNECLQGYINARGEKNFGSIQLKLTRSDFNGEPVVLLSFTYAQQVKKNPPSRMLECSDPSANIQSLLENELASWSFVRLAEFCAN